MTIEADIFNALKGFVSNRVYPDVAPEGAAKPYVTYQDVGGEAVNFIDSTLPGKRNGRFQVRVWSMTRVEANTIARQAEDALRAGLKATVIGGAVSVYEEDTKLFGTSQDFSIWY